MSDQKLEEEIRAAWDEIYRPAPWLLTRTSTIVQRPTPARRRLGWLAGVAAALVALSSIAVFETIRQDLASRRTPITPVNRALLPQPTPQPITRTGLAAQVAWLSLEGPTVVGVDPTGRVVARVPAEVNPYGVWRSPDGSKLLIPAGDTATEFSAADGTPLKTYPLPSGQVVGDAFSPDGNWWAALILNSDLQLDAINLVTGTSQLATIERNSKTGSGAVAFAGDSSHVYALTGWEVSMRLTAFTLTGGKLVEVASGAAGEPNRNYPGCAGPAVPAWVIGRGTTLVAFCHGDGAVYFFDLRTLNSSGVVQSHQPNPFWLSPILTPDGQLLYLHQWPSFGDSMQVVDLTTRRLLGPLPTPTQVGQGGLFAGLVTDVYAGGVASTEPISPDGLRLYSATRDGVVVLRVPDLKPIAKLAPGFDAAEVWVSGDGQTIYATSEDGKTLAVARADGSSTKVVNLPGVGVGFVASEHG